MRPQENPFYLLNATPADPRQRLQQLAEDAQLGGHAERAEAAYTALIKPTNRLDAELRWLPGANAHAHAAVMAQIDSGRRCPAGMLAQPLARMNLILFSLTGRETCSPAALGRQLASICRLWGQTDPIALLECINAQRLAGGWKTVTPEQLHTALKAYLYEIAAFITDVFLAGNAQPLRESAASPRLAERKRKKREKKTQRAHARALHALIRRYEKKEDGFAHNELIEELTSRYELHIAARAQEEKAAVLALTQERHNPPEKVWSPKATSRMHDSLREWHRLTWPVRRLAHARGLANRESLYLADEVRLFMVEVFNRYRQAQQALEIISVMRYCFKEQDETLRQLKEDETIITLARKAARQRVNKRTGKPVDPRVERIKQILGILLILFAAYLSRT